MDSESEGPEVKALQPGQYVLNRFRLERMLGRGGMAVVWLGVDQFLDERVALKFLPQLVVGDAHSLSILAREVKEARRLTHPHIIRIHDLLMADNIAAISMNWVDGSTLSELRVGREPPVLEVETLEPLIPQILSALKYAHEEVQIVHRDLKPTNIMVDREGQAVITDFAIARSITDTTTQLTNQDISGTLVYMSPQQIMGKNHHTNDYYSLGATLYDLLTGMPPFWTGDVTEQILNAEPVSIAERRREFGYEGKPIPEAWEEAIRYCLQKKPEDRPSRPEDLLSLLISGNRGLVMPDWKPEPAEDKPKVPETGGQVEDKKPIPPPARPRGRVIQRPVHRPIFPETRKHAKPDVEASGEQSPPPPIHRQSGGKEDRFPWGQIAAACSLVLLMILIGFVLQSDPEESRGSREEANPADERLTPGELLSRLQAAEAKIEAGRLSEAETLLEPALRNRESRYRARQLLHAIQKERNRVEQLFQRAETLTMQRRFQEVSTILEELTKTRHAEVERGYQLGRLEALISTLQAVADSGDASARPAQHYSVPMTGADDLVLVWIPPGEFNMGSPPEEAQRDPDERTYPVTLTNGFYLGSHEVTQDQYESMMGMNPSHFESGDGRAPVEQVDWFDVMEFCGKLTRQEQGAGRLPDGMYFTLPTEAQWEYACRAGTSTPFFYGSSLSASQANFNGKFPYGEAPEGEFRQRTLPVGSFDPNAFGLYDMHGNVREWCRNWYGPYPTGAGEDPPGPVTGQNRSIRGGSWFNSARYCRSAERSSHEPDYESDLLGFRVALVHSRD